MEGKEAAVGILESYWFPELDLWRSKCRPGQSVEDLDICVQDHRHECSKVTPTACKSLENHELDDTLLINLVL